MQDDISPAAKTFAKQMYECKLPPQEILEFIIREGVSEEVAMSVYYQLLHTPYVKENNS